MVGNNSNKEVKGIIRFKNSLAMLALCNNVNPSYEEEYVKDGLKTNTKNCRVLQASSPDEKSFVEFTDEIGFYMLDRNINNIIIRSHLIKSQEQSKDLSLNSAKSKDNLGLEMNFEELVSVPFRSETKRMRNVIKTE